jgi:glutamine amidotransferase
MGDSLMIVVVDYEAGNMSSVVNMLRKVGASAKISREPEEILSADKLCLPGVGHFDYGMKRIRSLNLIEPLNEFVCKMKKPILGICLGAQMLGKGSEEGGSPGLGWIDMYCNRFPQNDVLKVPHMGWNTISVKNDSPLFSKEVDRDTRFYFVHSYYIKCNEVGDIIATTNHGVEFVSVVQRENIMGTQFHPEKSHRYGLKLMQMFADI